MHTDYYSHGRSNSMIAPLCHILYVLIRLSAATCGGREGGTFLACLLLLNTRLIWPDSRDQIDRSHQASEPCRPAQLAASSILTLWQTSIPQTNTRTVVLPAGMSASPHSRYILCHG